MICFNRGARTDHASVLETRRTRQQRDSGRYGCSCNSVRSTHSSHCTQQRTRTAVTTLNNLGKWTRGDNYKRRVQSRALVYSRIPWFSYAFHEIIKRTTHKFKLARNTWRWKRSINRYSISCAQDLERHANEKIANHDWRENILALLDERLSLFTTYRT